MKEIAAMTYDDLLLDFLTSKRAGGLAATTLDWYEWNLRAYAQWLAKDPARMSTWTTRRTIEMWFEDGRAAGKKATTIEGRYRALSVFFGFLVDQDEYDLETSPLKKVKRPKVREDQVTRRRASEEEVAFLLQSIDGEDWIDARDRALVVLLFATGLRVAEVAKLTIEDVDLRERRLVAKGKNGTVRSVPFHEGLGPALLAYLMARPAYTAGPALWLSTAFRAGQRCTLTDNGIRQMLQRRCEDAGMRYLNPHSFRHGSAMHLLKKTGNLKFVSTFLRHSSTTITAKIYTEYEADLLRDTYDEAWKK